MNGATLQSRCWNHGAREAVCRCPECGHSFCRECVTEHGARLLCAPCLAAQTRITAAPRRHRAASFWLALAGLLLAWLLFYGTGEASILITGRMEQTSWQNR